MANRFTMPRPQFLDSVPNVREGSKLYFYASGTSTPLATYSDATLVTPNANPLILNALGQPSTAIFLSNAAYKFVLTDPNDVEISTDDPVYASDFSTRAILRGYAGNPNGFVAGSAASTTIGADVLWDYMNSILYVCSATGDAASAVWTAINASTSAAVVPQPQGRLTLTSATPVISGDVAAATVLYYAPYNGNIVPIYNGASFAPIVVSELALNLHSTHIASTIYDVFAFNNSGVVTLVTGPAWTNSGAGTGARGAGAGTTELSRINGLLVNAVSMTGRNGATTYNIGANLATYLGTIFIDASAGQLTCHVSYGQIRRWSVWNAYNRRLIRLLMGDATPSWTYGTATVRQSRGNPDNVAQTLCGLAEEPLSVMFEQNNLSVASTTAMIGVGVNSTTVMSGKNGQTVDIGTVVSVTARHIVPAGIGFNNIFPLENQSQGGAVNATFSGGQDDMLMVVEYWG